VLAWERFERSKSRDFERSVNHRLSRWTVGTHEELEHDEYPGHLEDCQRGMRRERVRHPLMRQSTFRTTAFSSPQVQRAEWSKRWMFSQLESNERREINKTGFALTRDEVDSIGSSKTLSWVAIAFGSSLTLLKRFQNGNPALSWSGAPKGGRRSGRLRHDKIDYSASLRNFTSLFPEKLHHRAPVLCCAVLYCILLFAFYTQQFLS
jgi:hypothetical protein